MSVLFKVGDKVRVRDGETRAMAEFKHGPLTVLRETAGGLIDLRDANGVVHCDWAPSRFMLAEDAEEEDEDEEEFDDALSESALRNMIQALRMCNRHETTRAVAAIVALYDLPFTEKPDED